MKAITIHQPWASLIAHGHKRYETRSWRTHYREPIPAKGQQGLWNWEAPELVRRLAEVR